MTAPEPSSLSPEDTALVAGLRTTGFIAALSAAVIQDDDGRAIGYDHDAILSRIARALADERRRAGALRERVKALPTYSSGPPNSLVSRNQVLAALAADEPTPPSHDESPETGAREDASDA